MMRQYSCGGDTCAVFLLLAATIIHAQTFTTLLNFNKR